MNSSGKQSFSQRLAHGWESLVTPAPSITEPGRRRQSRLLAEALVVFILMVIGLIFVLIIIPSNLPLYCNSNFYILMAGGGILVVTYFINRTGRYTFAAVFLFAIINVMIYVIAIITWAGLNPLYKAEDTGTLAFAIIPILFSNILLSVRFTVVIATADLALILTLPLLFRHVQFMDIVTGPFTFVLAASILTILAVHYQLQVQRDRSAEIIETEKQHRRLLESAFQGFIVSDER